MSNLRSTLQQPLMPVKTLRGSQMGKGDWLLLENVLYTDNKGIERKWERCMRVKERPSDIDGKTDLKFGD
jgi:hypothetical protein